MVTATNYFARFILKLFFFPISKLACSNEEGWKKWKKIRAGRKIVTQPTLVLMIIIMIVAEQMGVGIV